MSDTAGRITTDAVIVQTRGVTPAYRRDGDDGTLRLDRFVREPFAPADLAECPRVVDEHGDPLRALVVRSAPLAPGTRAQVRPVALLRPLEGPPVLVATPIADDTADAGLARLRPQLERLVQGDQAGYAQSAWRWGDVAEAAAYVQDGAARGALLRGGRRAVSAWETRGDAGATGASVAERQLGRLPARFQEFVREQLAPEERIVAFLQRPQTRSRLPFGAAIREALLLATDEQILWLEDARPRGSDLASWGYEARSMPLERVASVEAMDLAQAIRLELRSDAGGPPLVCDVPRVAGTLVGDVRAHVERFLTRDRPLPRRRYLPPERDDPLVVPGGWPDADTVARGLLGTLTRQIGPPALAVFVEPARLRDDGRGLLALYEGELVFTPADPTARAQRYDLRRVAWIELRRSLLGAHLRLLGADERTWTSASIAPLVTLFRPLRRLVANE